MNENEYFLQRMSSPAAILYVDHAGHPAPLTECYHATASRRLASAVYRYPSSTINTEFESAFCPQCLTSVDGPTAARTPYCTHVTCQSCPICLSPTSVTCQNSYVYFACGTCPWTSLECHLQVQVVAQNLEQEQEHSSSTTTATASPSSSLQSRVDHTQQVSRAAEQLGQLLNAKRRYENWEKKYDQSFTPQEERTAASAEAAIMGVGIAEEHSYLEAQWIAASHHWEEWARSSLRSRSNLAPSLSSLVSSSKHRHLSRTKFIGDGLGSLEALEKKLTETRLQCRPEQQQSTDVAPLERLNLDDYDNDDNDDDVSDRQEDNETEKEKENHNLDSPLHLRWLDPSLRNLSMAAFQMQILNGGRVVTKRSDLLPIPIRLRPRKSRRCRAELREGRAGILLKPRLNPLEGDSSLRTGHGQWWKKDSSAIHIIPKVSVVNVAEIEQPIHSLVYLLKVTNPTLGPLRVRFALSTYLGEPDWNDPSQATTTDLDGLLLDTFTQQSVHAKLIPSLLCDLPVSESVELLSAEDSIIEMGGRAHETPAAIRNWKPRSGHDASTTTTTDIDNTALPSIRLLTQNASMAWFELAFVAPSSRRSTEMATAAAFRLQVEVGQGSWETSFIPCRQIKDVEHKKEQAAIDYVDFDLVLVS